MMASFTTMPALRALGDSLRAGALEAFCARTGLTHDGGVGGFLTWEHAIPFVPLDRAGAVVKEGSKRDLCAAALVHALGRTYNPYTMRRLLDGCPGGADDGLLPYLDVDSPATASNRTRRNHLGE